MRPCTRFCLILLTIGYLLIGVGCKEETATKRLSVTVAGSASVSSDPAGIDCGQDCQHDFSSGTQVTLTATPETGYELESWGGACSGSASTCDLKLSEDRIVTATFAESGNEDPCEGVSCFGHGSCEDGKCKCDTGYAGDDCSGCADGYVPSGEDCIYSTQFCGNGAIDTAEECDGTKIGGNDCTTVGNYVGGTLACASDCTFDTSGCTAPSASSWIGIPDPDLGTVLGNCVTYALDTLPSNWTSNVADWYFVQAGGTNTENGYPSNPRGTIPNPIPAGATVVVDGTITQAFTDGSNQLVMNGTATSPAVLRSYTDNETTLTERMEVIGTYAVIDNINFTWTDTQSSLFRVLPGSSYFCLRNSELQGTGPNSGGTYIMSSNIVFFNNHIHHTRWTPPVGNEGTERHGCKGSSSVSNVWLLANEWSYNNGDGVQFGSKVGDTFNHIYVGGNIFHHNRQSGFWTKGGSDVIVSQNIGHSHSADDSDSCGHPFGGQYGTDFYWIIFNTAYDNEGGVRIASSSSSPKSVYVLGNLFYQNSLPGDVINSNSAAGVSHWPQDNIRIVNNTIVKCGMGIASPADGTSKVIQGNIITAPRNLSGESIWYSFSANSNSDCNIFESTASIKWNTNSSSVSFASHQSANGQDANSGEYSLAGIGFADEAKHDYTLTSGSPARGLVTTRDSAYATFLANYGISIEFDHNGNPLPASGAIDAGCFQYQ